MKHVNHHGEWYPRCCPHCGGPTLDLIVTRCHTCGAVRVGVDRFSSLTDLADNLLQFGETDRWTFYLDAHLRDAARWKEQS